MIIALAEMNLWYIFKVMWLWRDEIIIACLISLIWVNFSRCTYLPTLLVVGLMEIDISVLISILTWIPQKSWTHGLNPPYWEIFKIRNTNIQERLNEKNLNSCKAICFTSKRKKIPLICHQDKNEVTHRCRIKSIVFKIIDNILTHVIIFRRTCFDTILMFANFKKRPVKVTYSVLKWFFIIKTKQH